MGISEIQMRELMNKYDQLRMNNQILLDQRYEEVIQAIPEIGKIRQELVELAMKQARLELLDAESAAVNVANYQEQNDLLIQKKYDLLSANGYSRDYLSPIYHCRDCKDTGYIDFKPCHCLKKKITKILYKSSHLEHILDKENFNYFSECLYDDTVIDQDLTITARENILKLKNVCKDFILHFDQSFDNLIFYGPTGVGKTFLTHCIAKELLDTGHSVVYLTSLQLFAILEENVFGKSKGESSITQEISFLLDSDLLIIDDLGTELTNSFIRSQLYFFIEERIQKQNNTIFSTNLSFQELHDRYDERIFSRFTGYYNFCKVIGEDIRPKKRFTDKNS